MGEERITENMLVEDLKRTLSVQSYRGKQFRMFAFIVRELKKIDGVRLELNNGNLYATKGYSEAFPCIVSHIDTVHRMKDDLTVLEYKGMLTGFDRVKMQQTGIGGDDKVGVFICIQSLKYLDNIKAVFFRDEETGCNGSSVAKMSFFEDCGFVLQCDRQGSNDFVLDACGTELASEDFHDSVSGIMDRYNYKACYFGGMTDVYQLKENGIKVAVANMSCGYYRPHSDDEFVVIRDVFNTMGFVFEIFEAFGGEVFEHIPVVKSWKRGGTYRGSASLEDLWMKDPETGKWRHKTKMELDEDRYERWLMLGAGVKDLDKGIVTTKDAEDFLDDGTIGICEEKEVCPNCGGELDDIDDDPFCHNCLMFESDARKYAENMVNRF